MSQISSPRFPTRPAPMGQIAEPYTDAELRMIHYVNSVVRGSDKPGTELREALSVIESLTAYWEHKEQDIRPAPSRGQSPCSVSGEGAAADLGVLRGAVGGACELDPSNPSNDGPKPIAPIKTPLESVPPCKSAEQSRLSAAACCGAGCGDGPNHGGGE